MCRARTTTEESDMAAKSPKLTQKKGKRLAGGKPIPSSQFALPGERYPVDTPGRARNALSRGAQNASPAEQAAIKRKVKAKYPSMAVGGKKPAARRGK